MKLVSIVALVLAAAVVGASCGGKDATSKASESSATAASPSKAIGGSATPPTSTPTASPSPTPPAGGLSIVSVTSPVRHGANASLTAKSIPGEKCILSYRTPAGTNSTAAGLGQETVSSSGQVTWTWKIGTNTNPGTGTLVVACGSKTVSGTIVIN